ncbi:hypothetical protein GGTG_13869 [Gaeumannomyces tritici R3-111a-1]|uniref:Uncharacterized protein n=1 Tax=Gaeumannomyces tritici (strain R3-111a-1) TaxID=644352 RepID=J3PK23_GAET3|nr:hypothetical protein GGTG_13869 [Gaeumannomyces tritici R3-111a-1]EJT68556.1 hypothetical protein GGTG_13869 [Gaeumannomyces tritici R3-111a-1]
MGSKTPSFMQGNWCKSSQDEEDYTPRSPMDKLLSRFALAGVIELLPALMGLPILRQPLCPQSTSPTALLRFAGCRNHHSRIPSSPPQQRCIVPAYIASVGRGAPAVCRSRKLGLRPEPPSL